MDIEAARGMPRMQSRSIDFSLLQKICPEPRETILGGLLAGGRASAERDESVLHALVGT